LDTANGLYARIDSLTIGYTAGALEVLNGGITGIKLDSGVVDATKGLTYSANQISVVTDTDSIDFDGSGRLKISDNYLDVILGTNVVTQISTGGVDIMGNIDLTTSNTDSYNIISLSATAVHNVALDDTLVLTLDLNEAIFDAKIQALVDVPLIFDRVSTIFTSTDSSIDIDTATPNVIDIQIAASAAIPIPGASVSSVEAVASAGSSADYSRADHVHNVSDGALTIAKTSNLQTTLDTKIEIGTAVGNITIEAQGLVIDSGTNRWRLIVDSNGNLDTVLHI
ncbi:unnamed protein product, partial [marine sediment metagenome]